MEHVTPLFGEAWQRQRRRRRRLAWVGVVLCAAAIAAIVVTRPGSESAPAGISVPPGAIAESPSAVFSQAPYMGVRCAIPNSIACDRVGLAIWLKRPAYSVTASIDRRVFAMNRFGDQLVRAPVAPRRELDGYLRPAGIESSLHVKPNPGTKIWDGDPTPDASVRLLIDYGNGHYVTTQLQVPLMAGWG